jgi:hypothetical protein
MSFIIFTLHTRQRSWLRYYATSRKVTGSNPDVFFFFSVYLILPAALWPPWLTQPLTEMSIRNIPGGKGRPTREADNLTVICEPTVKKLWEPRPLITLWAFTSCYRDSFTLLLLPIIIIITVAKSSKKCWKEHVARMKEMRNARIILVSNHKGKGTTWEIYTKVAQ